MNWDDLRVLLAVAEAGSLAGAARRLSVNHSTAFRRLNTLEDNLGTRLFERLPQGYILTPAGERALELARQAENVVQGIEREIAGRDLAAAGKVRITAAPNIARTLLPPVLRDLRRSHPRIMVEVATGDSDYDLNRREADIALRATTSPPEHLIGRQVMTLDWWLTGSAALRRWRPRNSRELGDAPLVGADKSLMHLAAFQWLESNYGNNIVARANDLSTMAALALAGVGLALLPSDQQEKGLQRHCKLPDLHGELWLLTHPDLRNVQRIKVVWNAILELQTKGELTK